MTLTLSVNALLRLYNCPLVLFSYPPPRSLDYKGEVTGVYHGNATRDSHLCLSTDQVKDLYTALRTFEKLLYDPRHIVRTKLQEGECCLSLPLFLSLPSSLSSPPPSLSPSLPPSLSLSPSFSLPPSLSLARAFAPSLCMCLTLPQLLLHPINVVGRRWGCGATSLPHATHLDASTCTFPFHDWLLNCFAVYACSNTLVDLFFKIRAMFQVRSSATTTVVCCTDAQRSR